MRRAAWVLSLLLFGSPAGAAPAGGEAGDEGEGKKSEKTEGKRAAEAKAAGRKVHVDESGLKWVVLKKGQGRRPHTGETVVVHYTGRLKKSGKKFDSSRDRDKPFLFVMGQGRVIPGWELVVSKMPVGARWRVTIPPDLAYGRRGVPGKIPENATLVFDIELLGMEGQANLR